MNETIDRVGRPAARIAGRLDFVDGPKGPVRLLAVRAPSVPERVARRPIGPDGSVADPALEIADRRIGKLFVRRHLQIVVADNAAPGSAGFFPASPGTIAGPESPPLKSASRRSTRRLFSVFCPPWHLKARRRQHGPDLRFEKRLAFFGPARWHSAANRSGQHSAQQHRQRHGESHTPRHPKDQ